MYRLFAFILLSIVAVSEGCQPPPCHWNDAKPIEDYFIKVANIMIAADKKAQNSCNQQGSPNIKEVHKPRQYKLIYPSAGGDVFEIKVRNRVMLVLAENCMGTVADVRVLPTYVDGRGGYYTVEADELVITFPYKFHPALGGGTCAPPDGSIITLPLGCNDCDNNHIW